MMSASFTVALPSHSPSLLLVHFLPTCLGFTEAVSEEVGGEARGGPGSARRGYYEPQQSKGLRPRPYWTKMTSEHECRACDNLDIAHWHTGPLGASR